VQRVQSALKGRDPFKVLGMPVAEAKAYADGDKGVDASESLNELGATLADPFCRGGGACALLLAVAGR
jgi:hypothetical protein